MCVLKAKIHLIAKNWPWKVVFQQFILFKLCKSSEFTHNVNRATERKRRKLGGGKWSECGLTCF